jgi:putative tricarboxylic transport membrane protein
MEGRCAAPLCVFDNKQLQQTEEIADGLSWSEIPTCKSQGIDVECLMLRGGFTTPGAAPDQVAYYIDVLKKVRENAGMESADERRRIQSDLHDRRRLRQVARR